MNNSLKLGTIEAIVILSIITANKIILNLPKLIIQSTGTSGWINTIYIVLLAFIFIIIVTKLLRRLTNMDLLDASEYLGGTTLKAIVSFLHVLVFIIIITTILKNFSDTLKVIYFQQSPMIFIMLFFVVATSISNKYGLKAISKVTLYIFPLAFIGLIILLFSPAKDFEPQRLLPIFGYGLDKTFISGTLNIFALSGLGYIFFMPTILKSNANLRKIALISLGISAFFLLLSTCCLLLVFPFVIDTNESRLLYLLTMFMHHGNLIHGINTLFVLVWILSILSYISITFSFILFVCKKNLNFQDTTPLNYCICSIILGFSLLLQNNININMHVQNILKYSALMFVFVIDPLLLVFANIKKKYNLTQTERNNPI